MWVIDFMGPFYQSFSNLYILVVFDNVSKWIETIETPTNDAKVLTKLLVKNIFSRHGTPRAIISDEGAHFYNKLFENLMENIWDKAQGCYNLPSSK